MRVLTDPAETGAVTVALPQDVQGEAYDYPLEFLAKRVHHFDRRPPAEAALARVADLIAASKKPFVIVGGGVRYSGAGEETAAFCGQFRIPLGETQGGKGAVDSGFPLNMLQTVNPIFDLFSTLISERNLMDIPLLRLHYGKNSCILSAVLQHIMELI